jgi:hypothetical protein
MLLIYLIGTLKWVEFDVSIHIGGMLLRNEQKVIVKCSS